MTTPIRFPKYYVALADFSLANSAPPRVYKYEWTNVALRWSYCDVEVGDMINSHLRACSRCTAGATSWRSGP